MAWTTITYSFGSVLTSTKMTQNQDNFTALAQGLSGAPKIQTAALEQTASSEAVTTATIRDLAVTDAKLSISAITNSKLASNAVTQPKLSVASGTVSVAGGESETTLTLPGGSYGFYPQLTCGNPDSGMSAKIFNTGNVGISTSYATLISLTPGPGSYSITAQQTYIQASPPYDLGDGEIPLFIFVKVNALGAVLASYVAPEAPWHYNGPTDTRAEQYRAGRGYRKVKQFFAEHGSVKAALLAGMTRDQIAMAIATSQLVEVEVTQAIKNADMLLIPHPFASLLAPGESVIMLDPVSPFVGRASRLHEGGESICDLLHSGDIIFGNTDLPRNRPSGVLVTAPRWKLT